MNKIFRENLDFLFERFEAHDLCSIVVICLEILSKFVKFGICPYLTLKCSNITVIVIYYNVQELQRLVENLKLTHELLSEHVKMDAFPLMMGEMTETISLVSFSGRVATQVINAPIVSYSPSQSLLCLDLSFS
jgi:cytoplasmic FMR1 interacting protein